ncbi:MAG: hypothetical protein RLZZ579_126 [Actinomycetota bacterium]
MADLAVMFDVHMFINPETREVDEMYAYHSFGISRRENGTWEAYTREGSNLNQLNNHIEYTIDWDTDFTANEDAPEGGALEHAAVLSFDAGTLDEEAVMKYGVLYRDPTAPSDPGEN